MVSVTTRLVCPVCGRPPDVAGPTGYKCELGHNWPRDNGEVAPERVQAEALRAAAARRRETTEAETPGFSTWAQAAATLGPVTWHWERWLAPGFLHILAARTGLGKSTLALRVAACYLMGWPWPDGRRFEGEPGAVLWLESEAAHALNVDRATRWGLPLAAIRTCLPDPLEDFSLLNRKHREAAEEAARDPQVKLIVLDSLSGARASADENDSRALASTKWLAELARNTSKPLLVLHHLRKRSLLDGNEEVNLERLRGSSAILQTARLVWALDTPDPAHPSRLRLQVLKSNLSRFPAPLGMGIEDDGRVTFGEAPEPPTKENASERAASFVRRVLANGPVKASEVVAAAEREGIPERTLRRVKDTLCVESRRAFNEWWWRLDGEDERPGQDCQNSE